MIKNLFGQVEGLLATNIGFAAITSWVANADSLLHCLLTVAQVLVALATAVYVWRKAKAVAKTDVEQ